MSKPHDRPRVADLELDASTEASLYLELIRIIERDIDEINQSNARSGWTSWAIIGAIVGALLLLLGETRKLSYFPSEDVKQVAVAGLLLCVLLFFTARAFGGFSFNLRPGKIRWTVENRDVFLPSALYRLAYFIGTILVIFRLSLSGAMKVLIASPFVLQVLLLLAGIPLWIKKQPLSDNKIARRSFWGFSILSILLCTIGLVTFIPHLHSPVGEAGVVPFVIAGLIIAIVLLTDILLFNRAPYQLLSNLKELRSDIIFLRLDIDQALRRYETLIEGETLPDIFQEKLGEFLRDLDVIEYTYKNMDALLTKMEDAIPGREDEEKVLQEKAAQIKLNRDSLFLHNAQCNQVWARLKPQLDVFYNQLNRLSLAAGDEAGRQSIQNILTARFNTLKVIEDKLNERYRGFDQRLEELSNSPS